MILARLEKLQDLSEEEALLSRIKDYWDERSAAFGRVRLSELQGPDGAAWLKLIESRLPAAGSLSILDAGTGAGFFAIILSMAGHSVTGIDMSAKMIRQAKENMLATGCRADFRQMSAQELDFAAGSFDIVVSRNLTWTLPDAAAAYKEWRRVLKPGGMIFNFDSDLRGVTFTKKEDNSDVHAGISMDLINECNDIKNSLSINEYSRPDWDRKILQKLGFEVETEADIRAKVRLDSTMKYDNIPLFAVYAKKGTEQNSDKQKIFGV